MIFIVTFQHIVSLEATATRYRESGTCDTKSQLPAKKDLFFCTDIRHILKRVFLTCDDLLFAFLLPFRIIIKIWEERIRLKAVKDFCYMRLFAIRQQLFIYAPSAKPPD